MKVSYKNCIRKELVKAIEEITGVKAKYLGIPSYGYQLDDIFIDKDGVVELQEPDKWIVTSLKDYGFEPSEEIQETESKKMEFTVILPRTSITDIGISNLRQLVANKKSLLKKALGTSELDIIVNDEQISFPWFTLEQEGDALLYATFIEKLVSLSNKQHRMNKMGDSNPPNERYAFRCFLLRLGFIGKDYKAVRKLLLKNLSGSAAFKYPKEETEDEV